MSFHLSPALPPFQSSPSFLTPQACLRHSRVILQFLLVSGADPNIPSKGRTPLFMYPSSPPPLTP